jgi:hypothetical protein
MPISSDESKFAVDKAFKVVMNQKHNESKILNLSFFNFSGWNTIYRIVIFSKKKT